MTIFRNNKGKAFKLYFLKFLNYFNYRNELGTKAEVARRNDVLRLIMVVTMFLGRGFPLTTRGNDKYYVLKFRNN